MIKDVNQSIEWTKDQLKALNQSDVTITHKKRGSKLETSFINGLTNIRDKDGNQKWIKMLELIPNTNWKITGGPKKKPRAFSVVSGKPSIAKIRLCNAMVVDWQINLKKKNRSDEDQCPFYQPNAQNTELRVFFCVYEKDI